ncbi:Lrp/AsnC family transcriptional regulator [Aneurinibacillus tyrosinisolvens]|uniref:Lrp/AsnC family transcriptional regulator n=1 Tax=Aneurinibacillus tyrosinisolvens TaxID=1443435 RepID=UPI00063FB1F2|nr:Lrp/AsnC family transcriptional regulator [Aneurinibacillus tyrosinisolvens]
MRELDKLDKEIIKMLQEDARYSYTLMAEELGVSEGTIRGRINRMLEDKVFEFIINSEPEKVGLPVSAVISISTNLGYQEKVAQELVPLSEVGFIAACSGLHDLIIQAYFTSNGELMKFTNEKLGNIEGISSISVSIELREYKNSFSYLAYEEEEKLVLNL